MASEYIHLTLDKEDALFLKAFIENFGMVDHDKDSKIYYIYKQILEEFRESE